MKIKTWHVGKIVMLWAWCAALVFVDLQVVQQYRQFLTEHVLIGFSLLALLFFAPLILSGVTWCWFSGKEPVATTPTMHPESSTLPLDRKEANEPLNGVSAGAALEDL